jgi:predicted P-loop ATPase
MADNNKKSREAGQPHPQVDTAALLDTVDIVKVIDGHVSLTKNGVEYEACCPFHTENTPSFKVSPTKQFYNCFGCGVNGDAIKFLMEYRGLSFLDACRELGADIPESGVPTGSFNPPAAVRREAKQKKDAPVWTPITPVPADAPEPPKAHFKRGLPAATWSYRDAVGGLIGYVYRFTTSDGGKETLPLVWAQSDAGKQEWHWLSFAKPRPLYGLDRLAARPDVVVLLVEGEKCADAGALNLPDLVVVSWPGGGKAIGKVDWSPLAGRKVITWADCDAKRVPLTPEEIEAIIGDSRLAGMIPGRERTALVKELMEQHREKIAAAQLEKPLLPEADQPGVKAMAAIHKQLHALDATVWAVKIPAPGEKPDGWDIADAVEDGLRDDALADHIRERMVRVPVPGAVDEIPLAALAAEGISTPSGACASPPDHGDYFDDGGHTDSIWRRTLLRKDGRLIDCRENVYLMLRYHPAWQGVLWADEFAKKIVMRRPPPWRSPKGFEPGTVWDADDALRLGLWLAQQERMIVKNVQNLTLSVGWAANENRCHPVREYLDGLKWDGALRIDKWLTDYMGVKESEYSRLVGRFFLIGLVARIYRPGCQMRFMPIFEGRQYRGKSSAFRVLGGKWYSDTSLNLHNKDSYQLIQGVWVYEIAELDSFSRADSTMVKAFISSQIDRFRAPYAAAPEDHPRCVGFGGSTNEGEYFKDETGNTRYWPLRCEEVDSINIEGLTDNRDQLFAEAVELFRSGDRWHPTAEEQQTLFEPEQAEREVVDPWFERVAGHLSTNTFSRVTALELLTDCLKIEVGKIGRAKAESMTISKIMRRLGWKKEREPTGNRLWYYSRPAPAVTEAESSPATAAMEVPDVPF